jgi:transposase
MPRLMLSDEFWSKLEKILLQETIYNKRNLRMTVEGMLYRMRVGCPWRDLPKAFGSWNSIYKRFNAWSLSSKWGRIFKSLIIDPDCEWEFIDGSYVKAHQHSAGAAGKKPQAIGKSRAGNTTKIHLVVDSYGLPIEFEITGGEYPSNPTTYPHFFNNASISSGANGSNSSIRLLGQAGSFSRVSASHSVGLRPLSFAVPSRV